MAEFPISWQFQHSNSNAHRKKNRYVSELKINTEWSLVCIWSQCNPYKPEILEIHRNSTAKEILVSGTFKLMRDGLFVLQRKFVQLIEAGFATTQIELEYSNDNSYYNRNYSITGTLTIPAYTADNEYAKGVQFKSLLDLSNDLECLLDPKTTYFSDVNVNCGTVSFSAHKNILCARSPVFAAMFTTQHGKKRKLRQQRKSKTKEENRDNKVKITDLSPQVLKTMLTYIYSGKTGELSVQSAGELLFAADKYQLQEMKRVCSDFLKSCVSAGNVLSTLVLGYLHDKDLKVFAMDFICNICEEFEVLEKTVEWKNLREKRPSLAMDVLTGLVKSKDKKLRSYK
ncbi:Speckle-type POZ protein-like A [Araneus ventricosus]|uniref:Speckle-type POZ protein-like A n=1 Tax=Araneus ventricosus TaxID=182803 RepID=A0A4Y2SHX0_ARAVE|nr:Speckle-type POZ protein-like A [Araneus ventricosus]